MFLILGGVLVLAPTCFSRAVDLFREYDQIYFGGALVASGVQVGWSGPRMTLCAGVCKYRGPLGGVEIVLSMPLLQLRSVVASAI